MEISCKNAAFGYDGHIAVHGLNFSIHAGEFLLVAGVNGSGKSTLIKGLLQLLPPMEGTLNFDAELCTETRRVEGSPLPFAKARIGYLSQQAVAKQDFPAGVFEIVLSGNLGKKGLWAFYNHKDKRKAEENLRLLSISELKKSCFRELSGGQQRRVLLARSLCAAEKLLVLDEPFAGLDPLISQELYQLLEKINREMGMTIIMVSHDIEAAGCATHVLHLSKKQLFFGSMDEYRQSEIGRKFFAKKEPGMEGNDV